MSSSFHHLVILKALYIFLSRPDLTIVMPFMLVLARPPSLLAVGPECCSSSFNSNTKTQARFYITGLPSLAPCVF